MKFVRSLVFALLVALSVTACTSGPPAAGDGDADPPMLLLPGDITRTTTNELGAHVEWNASAHDVVDGPVPVTCTPEAGWFAVGVTVVSCRATDLDGQTVTGQFTVTVTFEDLTPSVVQISAGFQTTCARLSDGTVSCWGSNHQGALGGATTEPRSYAALRVPGLDDVVSVSVGTYHVCAVIRNGTVKCWGNGLHGELGNGPIASSAEPTAVSGLNDAVDVAAGAAFTCARRANGRARCWGYNGSGQLGNGTTVDSNTPVDVLRVAGASTITAGGDNACVIELGIVKCWGNGGFGLLGSGLAEPSSTPVQFPGLFNVKDIVRSSFHHTCMVLDDRSAHCLGNGVQGQLGHGAFGNTVTPTAVVGLTEVSSIAAGYHHTCAVLDDGAALCRGANADGQLGDGSTANSNVPRRVTGLGPVSSVSLGTIHSCALLDDGTVWCWGRNLDGRVGTGGWDGGATHTAPVQVVGLP